MRTLLYVDDLLIACSSFEEATKARHIIEDTLLAAGIVRAPLKDCFATPPPTLSNHLVFIISSIGKGALRSQRGDALLCGAKLARCSSRQSRIVVWSTPTFSVSSRVQSYLVCHRFH